MTEASESTSLGCYPWSQGELQEELQGELQEELQGELQEELQEELQGELQEKLQGELQEALWRRWVMILMDKDGEQN